MLTESMYVSSGQFLVAAASAHCLYNTALFCPLFVQYKAAAELVAGLAIYIHVMILTPTFIGRLRQLAKCVLFGILTR